MIDNHIKNHVRNELSEKWSSLALDYHIYGVYEDNDVIVRLLHTWFEEKTGIQIQREDFIEAVSQGERPKNFKTLGLLSSEAEIRRIERDIVRKANER